jgi:integrase
MPKLTKKMVEEIPDPEKGYSLHWDSELKGLGLRVTASGVRSFILQTRIKGRDKRITLGRYPAVTPEIARNKAKGLIGEIAQGGDPIATKQREKLATLTLDEAFADYLKLKDLKESTAKQMQQELDESLTVWKKKPISKITGAMVERHYLELAKNSPARANLAFRYLRAVLNLAKARYRDAEDQPILSSNPVERLTEGKLWRKVARRTTVMKPDDLRAWVPAVVRLGEVPAREPGTGKQNPKLRNGELYRDYLLFLALTGCRKSEPLGLKRLDVDLERGFVTFRDTKNRKDHELPLTDTLKEILQRRLAESPKDKDLVFADRTGAVPSNLRAALARMTEETGLSFTFHDLRRLAATTMERLGVPGYTIKSVLNHAASATDVTGGYVQVDDEMKRKALEKLESFIMVHAHEAKVIPLRGAA